jgi:hypothetical protein
LKGMFDPAFCESIERQMAESSTTQIERMSDLAWKAPPLA